MFGAALVKQPTVTRPSYTEELKRLGMLTNRIHEYTVYKGDFETISREGSFLTLEEFVMDFERRGYSNAIRHAAFRTFDVDSRGIIFLEEYILCRTVFDFVPERDRGTSVIKYRLMIVFNLYDRNGDRSLQKSELESMVTDLATGSSHVLRLMRGLGVDDSANVSMDNFLKAIEAGHFDRHFLHTRDIFDMHSNMFEKSGRVILDPRAVVSGYLPKPPSLRDQPHRPDVYGSVCIADNKTGVLNAGLHWESIDPVLTTLSDWRGPLTPARESLSFKGATFVVHNASRLMLEHLNKSADGSQSLDTDIPDSRWLVAGRALNFLLGTTVLLEQLNILKILCECCKGIVGAQPVLVKVPAPAKIFGDIHGQFRDLLLIFKEFGFPNHRTGDIETTAYVFNGDFVDRGAHQIETIALLMALKICYPSRIFLIRGNHEFRGMNTSMGPSGFFNSCITQYGKENGEKIFDLFHETFAYLPLSALVGDSILVLHGGIGDGHMTLNDLESIPRPLYDDAIHPLVMNVLWSDPSDSDAVMRSGVHANSARDTTGVIKRFDRNITKGFCARENIQLIVRSHQFVPEGFRIMHGGHLITVFSARNYHDSETNCGALLLVAQDHEGNLRVRPKTYKPRDHSFTAYSALGAK